MTEQSFEDKAKAITESPSIVPDEEQYFITHGWNRCKAWAIKYGKQADQAIADRDKRISELEGDES